MLMWVFWWVWWRGGRWSLVGVRRVVGRVWWLGVGDWGLVLGGEEGRYCEYMCMC